jgi:hypothetical protein
MDEGHVFPVTLPERSFLDDDSVEWRVGKPDYTLVNKKYVKECKARHPEGSLAKTVENLVKTWEMEMTHKTRLQDIHSLVPEEFRISVNGGRKVTVEEFLQRGSYNVLMEESVLYQAKLETFESSHKAFKTAFNEGFAWEVLEVYSGPPKVSFKWRHWTNWTGPYQGEAPSGKLIELYGFMIATVNEDMKILEVEIFYDPNPFMKIIQGEGCPISGHEKK